MKYRIITHGGCTSMDGFASAFIFKKYFCPIYKIDPQDIEITGTNPSDIQLDEFKFQSGDIVLDLPQPRKNVFFWCDHHITAKPEGKLPKNYYWKKAPSCAGYLIDIAIEKGLQPSSELLEFKNAIDRMDNADYDINDIKLLYYPQKDYANPSMLQKVHIISSMFHTKDKILNEEIIRTLLQKELQDTPVSGNIWKLDPLMFYRAHLTSYQEWREWADTFMYLDDKAHCIVLDYREAGRPQGNTDRFYAFVKFPKSIYSLALKKIDDNTARINIGSNIFHKDWCKIDIGKLCKIVAEKFGEGAGGGHYGAGGAAINADRCDAALEYVLKSFKEGKLE